MVKLELTKWFESLQGLVRRRKFSQKKMGSVLGTNDINVRGRYSGRNGRVGVRVGKAQAQTERVRSA